MTSPAPVFGRRRSEIKRVSFALCSYDSRDHEHVHEFCARAGIDASTALQVNSRDAGQQARAIQHLLIRVLVDDDGIPRDEQPRRLPADGDDVEQQDGALILTRTDWVIGDDGKTFPSESLAAQHGRDHGSSLRRFAALMDDPTHYVELDALREIINHLSEQTAGRPTRPSGGSSPRRTATKRRR